MQRYSNRKKQQGMTLIEVMVAMTIGLVLTLMVVTLFVGQHRGYQQNEATARMQENGRFVLELLTQDLRHAGFFGDISDPVDVTTGGLSYNLDCLGGTKNILDLSAPQYMLGYGDRMKTNVGTNCLSSSAFDTTFGSSVFIVKRSAASPTADANLQNNTIYTYANGSAAEMYKSDGSNLSTLANGENWEYQPRIYFINNNSGKDTLQRIMPLKGTSEPLAEGIEAFHIEFGIDQDRNGAPEYFYTPAEGSLTDATLNNAVSATVYVLARTTKSDKDSDYTDNRQYNLGSITLGPFNDKFHRRVFTATTALKNIRAQVMLQQGL